MSTYLQLVNNLKREVGVAGSDVVTVSGQTAMLGKLVNWIADADEYIQSLHWDWKFLWNQYSQATVSGNAAPVVPSTVNVWDRDSFYIDRTTASYKRLTEVPYDTYLHSYGLGTHTNRKPDSVIIKPDNSIVVYPTPNAVYTVTADYWAKPTRLSDNGDESAIPAAFHRIIVVQAKLWYAEHEEINDLYAAASRELYGNKASRETGLLDRLESLQLPGQEARMMGDAGPMDIVVE